MYARYMLDLLATRDSEEIRKVESDRRESELSGLADGCLFVKGWS
jgi:hypothetical protein